MIELHLGDCLDVMRGMAPDCIDLTVTSPPYDNLRTYNGYTFDFEGIARELYRVTKPGGVVVWVSGDAVINGSETGTSFKQVLFFKDIGFHLHDTMIYEKNGSALPDTVRYLQCFEFMFVLSKGKPATTNLIIDRKNRYRERWGKGQTVREADGKMTERTHHIGNEFGRRFNIWRINNGYGYTAEEDYAYQHPAMFPEALARDHILSWSNPGDTVLDQMMGSGTTGKMAVKYARNFIGIETSGEYMKIAARRIHDASQQPALFQA